jgi:hypothetical protein
MVEKLNSTKLLYALPDLCRITNSAVFRAKLKPNGVSSANLNSAKPQPGYKFPSAPEPAQPCI